MWSLVLHQTAEPQEALWHHQKLSRATWFQQLPNVHIQGNTICFQYQYCLSWAIFNKLSHKNFHFGLVQGKFAWLFQHWHSELSSVILKLGYLDLCIGSPTGLLSIILKWHSAVSQSSTIKNLSELWDVDSNRRNQQRHVISVTSNDILIKPVPSSQLRATYTVVGSIITRIFIEDVSRWLCIQRLQDRTVLIALGLCQM